MEWRKTEGYQVFCVQGCNVIFCRIEATFTNKAWRHESCAHRNTYLSGRKHSATKDRDGINRKYKNSQIKSQCSRNFEVVTGCCGTICYWLRIFRSPHYRKCNKKMHRNNCNTYFKTGFIGLLFLFFNLLTIHFRYPKSSEKRPQRELERKFLLFKPANIVRSYKNSWNMHLALLFCSWCTI